MEYFKNYKNLGLLFLILLLSNCSRNDTRFDASKNIYADENNPINIPLQPSTKMLDFTSIGSIDSVIFLDTTEIIGSIDKLQFEGNNIYIMDGEKAKAIFCFSLGGKLKWKYGHQGNISQDFVRLGDFDVKDKKVYLFDNMQLKILKLNMDGKFDKYYRLKQNRFYPDKIFVDEKHKFILYNQDMGDYKYFPYEMVVLDSNLSNMQSFHFLKTHKPSIKYWGSELSPLQPFARNNGFYYTKAMNDTIFAYQDGKFSRKYAVGFGKFRVPGKIKKLNKFTLGDFWKSGFYGDIRGCFESDSVLTFQFTGGTGSNNYVLLNKKTNSTKVYGSIILNLAAMISQVLIIGTYNNKFIVKVEPIDILKSYKVYASNFPDKNDSEIDKILDEKAPIYNKIRHNVSINSNPVLLVLSISTSKLFNDAQKKF